MKLLFDTNILISRESSRQLSDSLRQLIKIINELKYQIFIHPVSIEEINGDKDKERKNISLSKISTYHRLENPPEITQQFIEEYSLSNERINDINDNKILYCLYRDSFDFLITQDFGLIKKASEIGVGQRTFSTKEALEFFRRTNQKEKISFLPAIKEKFCYEIKTDQKIFDTLKEDYPEFDKWWSKKSKEHRKVWIYENKDGIIGGLLMYKKEKEGYADMPESPIKDRLKICTLNVIDNGKKLGELFLKISIYFAVRKKIDEMYLTHFDKKNDYLIPLIGEYGFEKIGTNKREESIYSKFLKPNSKTNSIDDFNKKFFPSTYMGIDVKKFIIPIRPEYHDKLFTDYKARQTSLREHMGEVIIEGNPIKKAYLSKSNTEKIRKNDIIFFYRSNDIKSITNFGVVDRIYEKTRDADQILRNVGKRSVYNIHYLREMVKDGPVRTILFNNCFYFDKDIRRAQLLKNKIIKGTIQSITEISNSSFKTIVELGGLKKDYMFSSL